MVFDGAHLLSETTAKMAAPMKHRNIQSRDKDKHIARQKLQ